MFGAARRATARAGRGLAALVLGAALMLPAQADTLVGLARLQPESSVLDGTGSGLSVTLDLSQPVPWRLRFLDSPPRLVIDTREVDWRGFREVPVAGTAVEQVRAGPVRPGWSRMVVTLDRPMTVATAGMQTAPDRATIRVVLQPADAEAFAAEAARPDPADWDLPDPAALQGRVDPAPGQLVVVLDPGHGGIDPGAEHEGVREADLTLAFARELKDLLARDPQFLIVLTRDADDFVALESRVSIAHAAGADVFLSLHADALAEGEASGSVLYTLAEAASDRAAERLAERHGRDDLLAGVDLTGQDDAVARVLIDMARTATQPRTDRLSFHLEEAIRGAGLKMHRNPRQAADFSVLKSPEIPSVLVEMGFLSSARDARRLNDPDWRADFATALRDGLLAWAAEERALRSGSP
jgi:N-acetylmuramoyl-L-alanine amidase